ncbi:MAG: ABC transporter permease [Kineosporiaceae bacterium]
MTTAPPDSPTAQETARQWGLSHLGGRPPLRAYLTELWQRRHFALELARSRFRAKNEADRLGVGWIVLGPLINAAVYGVVFGVVLVSSARPDSYVPFLITGVFLFQFFAGSLADGARSIIANRGLVTTLHFPRAVLPFSVVYQQLLNQLWMVLALLLLVTTSGYFPTVNWLLVAPTLALMTLFNLGVAFVAARLTIHLRDIAQLIPFVTRMFFYLSGVFVSMPALLHGRPGWALQVAEANPIYNYITLMRVSLLGEKAVFAVPGHPDQFFPYDPVKTWLLAVAWGVGMLVVGFLFFWRAEDEYGRE